MVESMHNPAADLLAAAVVAMRKSAGLTQRELAAALGREQNFVARVETSQRRLDLIDLIKICRACDRVPETEVIKLLKSVQTLIPAKRLRR